MGTNRQLVAQPGIKNFVKRRSQLQWALALYRLGRRLLTHPDRVSAEAHAWAELRYEAYRLRRFKNCHVRQRRCFLVGNGPSIRHQDLTRLRGEIVFVTNSFVLHDQYEHIAPTYFCVSDPRFFRSGVNPEWGQAMARKTEKTVKFFPLASKRAIRSSGFFDGHSVYYVNYDPPVRIWETRRMSLDVSNVVFTGDSVIIDFCLPLAFFMGFSEIYLLGCDTDYGLDKSKDYSRGYFYDVAKSTVVRQAIDYHVNQWYHNVITSYSVAREVFERHGRKIYNATLGGKLEVFERVNYDDLARG